MAASGFLSIFIRTAARIVYASSPSGSISNARADELCFISHIAIGGESSQSQVKTIFGVRQNNESVIRDVLLGHLEGVLPSGIVALVQAGAAQTEPRVGILG
jgi:hypothetical protein